MVFIITLKVTLDDRNRDYYGLNPYQTAMFMNIISLPESGVLLILSMFIGVNCSGRMAFELW